MLFDSSEPDPCQSNPCQNGATCVHQVNTYICICPVNYEGRNCNKGNANTDNISSSVTVNIYTTLILSFPQKYFHTVPTTVCTRTAAVIISVLRSVSPRVSVNVHQDTDCRQITQAVCLKVCLKHTHTNIFEE